MVSTTKNFNKKISKEIFIKMWPTAISVIFNAMYLQADRLILPLYVSQSEVGLYGAAYRVLDVVIQIAALVMGMVMPLITYAWSRKMRVEFQERYELGVNLISLILFPIAIGIFVLAGPIMTLIAGKQFSGSGIMLQWLSISILGTAFGMIFGHIVLAIDRQKEALLIYGTDAILSITGYLVFIPIYGWLGAVWVTIFSELYAGFLLFFIAVVYSGFVPDLTKVGKIFLASVIMGIIIYAMNLPLIPATLFGIFIYFLLIVGFKVIKREAVLEMTSLNKVA